MSTSAPRLTWRVIDMVTAAILGVASGIIFLVWNQVGGSAFGVVDALTPGLGGIVCGIWLIGGVLGGLVIRKPGAALFVELLAAIVSMALGSQWGVSTVYSGIVQGLGAELVFALFMYRNYSVIVTMLAGAGAGAAAWVFEGFYSGNFALGALFLVIYLVTLLITGAVLAGLLGWLLVRGLARTGALDRFAAGREVGTRV